MQLIRSNKSEEFRFKSCPRFSNGKKVIYSVMQYTTPIMEGKKTKQNSGNSEEVQLLLMLVPDGPKRPCVNHRTQDKVLYDQ